MEVETDWLSSELVSAAATLKVFRSHKGLSTHARIRKPPEPLCHPFHVFYRFLSTSKKKVSLGTQAKPDYNVNVIIVSCFPSRAKLQFTFLYGCHRKVCWPVLIAFRLFCERRKTNLFSLFLKRFIVIQVKAFVIPRRFLFVFRTSTQIGTFFTTKTYTQSYEDERIAPCGKIKFGPFLSLTFNAKNLSF